MLHGFSSDPCGDASALCGHDARNRRPRTRDPRRPFLPGAARGPDVAPYDLRDVRVRLFDDVALVHATGVFTRRDGSIGTSRYTDVWALGDGGWKTISAQITRFEGAPD